MNAPPKVDPRPWANSLLFAPGECVEIPGHAPRDSILSAALVRTGAWCIHLAGRLRARRTLKRWATPEAERAYQAGLNLGAMRGVLYTAAVCSLCVAVILLMGIIR